MDNTINATIDDGEVEIINVTERINHIKKRKSDNAKIASLNDSIDKLRLEWDLIQCKVDALEKEKELLFKNEAIGGVSSGVSVDEIEKAADFAKPDYR